MRILIVEDEVDILETISDTIEIEFDLDIHMEKAVNGKDALEVCRKNSFDIVITDLNMPVMDGLTFAKEFRIMDQKVPIIVFTGHGDLEEVDKLDGIGVQAMVKKPYIQNLITELKKIIID